MATSKQVQDGGAVACSTKQTQLGEGVRWDARRGEMLGVDILAGRVARARIADDGSLAYVREYQLPWTVGMIAPVDGDGGWLLGAGRGFVYLAPDGTHRTIAELSPVRDPDERRRLRPPGPVLGRDTGRRPPRGRGRALPVGPNRPDRDGARAISRSPTESAGAPTA